MSEPIKLVAFCGSLRKGSFNRMALQVFIERAPAGTTVETIEIGDWPLYDADLQARGFADAQIYNPVDTSVGGIHAFFLLLGPPEELGLPPRPEVPTVYLRGAWLSAGATSVLALAAACLAFVLM